MIHPINIPVDLLAPNSNLCSSDTFTVTRTRHSISYTNDGRRLIDGRLITPNPVVNLWGDFFARSIVHRFNAKFLQSNSDSNLAQLRLRSSSSSQLENDDDDDDDDGELHEQQQQQRQQQQRYTLSSSYGGNHIAKSQSFEGTSSHNSIATIPNHHNQMAYHLSLNSIPNSDDSDIARNNKSDQTVAVHIQSSTTPFTPCCSAVSQSYRQQLLRLSFATAENNLSFNDEKSSSSSSSNPTKNMVYTAKTPVKLILAAQSKGSFTIDANNTPYNLTNDLELLTKQTNNTKISLKQKLLSLTVILIALNNGYLTVRIRITNHTLVAKVFSALIHNHLFVNNCPNKLLASVEHQLHIPAERTKDLTSRIEISDATMNAILNDCNKTLVFTISGNIH